MQIYSQQLDVVETLGSGPEARVYLARDGIGGSPAVWRQYTGPHAVDRVATEVRLLQGLAGCGFVAPRDVIFNEGDGIGYTMEHVAAPSLAEIAPSLDPSGMAAVLLHVSLAMAWLHALDYVHCDLKPGNVLVRQDTGGCTVWLIDLGFMTRTGVRRPTQICGSVGYMAPEVLQGEALSEATDVFSFGRVLAEMAGYCRCSALARAFRDLSDSCTNRLPESRPQSFWDVHADLGKSYRRVFGEEATVRRPTPPLRTTGLQRRVEMLKAEIKRNPGNRLVGVAGLPGSGKSRLFREYGLQQQLMGNRTLRVIGNDNWNGLSDILDCASGRLRRSPIGSSDCEIVVFVESKPGLRLEHDAASLLVDLAERRHLKVLVELRHSPEGTLPRGLSVFHVPVLTERECIHASSHLSRDPVRAEINGRGLFTATGGIPTLAQTFLGYHLWMRPGRAFDFDVVPAPAAQYWRDRLAELPENERSFLFTSAVFHGAFAPAWSTAGVSSGTLGRVVTRCAERGWLNRSRSESGGEFCTFAARSARNTLRQILGRKRLAIAAAAVLADENVRQQLQRDDPLGLRELERLAGVLSPPQPVTGVRRLTDIKLNLFLLLNCLRHTDMTPSLMFVQRLVAVCEQYATLGSIERQRQWALRALRLVAANHDGRITGDGAREAICRLYDLSGDQEGKAAWLAAALQRVAPSHFQARGHLLSEIGAIKLSNNDLKEACESLFAADALFARDCPRVELMVRNLNRLGIAFAMRKNFKSARKTLRQARWHASRDESSELFRRILGNLGWIARTQGESDVALVHLRKVAYLSRKARDVRSYLTSLSNQVVCLVDLGRVDRAMKTARLAMSLAEAVHDTVEIGHAANNLGWVYRMRGGMRRAVDLFQRSLYTRHTRGDLRGEIQSLLNLARVYTVIQQPAMAGRHCRDVLNACRRGQYEEGAWDCYRVLAKSAMDHGQYAAAEKHLSKIPESHPAMPPIDRIETQLLRLALALWKGENKRAGDAIGVLTQDGLVHRIHPLRCILAAHRGHWEILTGDYDTALRDLGWAARECRTTLRNDLLVDVLPVFALLAKHMGNWHAGLTYLRTAQEIIRSMREELT